MRAICMLLVPAGGGVTVGGFDVVADRRAVRDLLAYLPQHLWAWRLQAVTEVLDALASLCGLTDCALRKRRIREVLEPARSVKRPERAYRPPSGRGERKSRLLGASIILFVAATFVGRAAAQPADPVPIQEGMFAQIGGIEQWITIKGADRGNPVVLFLHGGPGSAWSPIADSLFPGWEQDFTLVQWDQRDAGRTFIRNGEVVEPTLTVERMTADGIEVAQFLREHLQRDKIILTGGSWGAVLGVRMAHARPDLFHAYVGLAQPTSWQQVTAASYAWVFKIAVAKSDATALEALAALGPPPWESTEEFMSFTQVRRLYQAELTTAPEPAFALADEYAAEVRQNGERNEVFALRYMLKLLAPIDVTGLTDFELPVFLVHGEADLTIPPESARAYFETIEAPRKELYLVPGTGHNPSATMLEKQREVMLREVRPLAIR